MNNWSYVTANETTTSGGKVSTSDGRRNGQGAHMENGVIGRFVETHVDAAASEARTSLMRRFAHLKGIDSVGAAVEAGLLTVEQWCDFLDECNQRHRQAKSAKLQRVRFDVYGTNSLRFKILSQLEDDSPIHINALFVKIGGLRGSFRDQLRKMIDEELVYFSQDTKLIRLTPKGIEELEYRQALPQA